MLFPINNHRSNAVYPQLSRVWIKTGNPKMPLKSVWFDEAKLHVEGRGFCTDSHDAAARELAEDHLVLAA